MSKNIPPIYQNINTYRKQTGRNISFTDWKNERQQYLNNQQNVQNAQTNRAKQLSSFRKGYQAFLNGAWQNPDDVQAYNLLPVTILPNENISSLYKYDMSAQDYANLRTLEEARREQNSYNNYINTLRQAGYSEEDADDLYWSQQQRLSYPEGYVQPDQISVVTTPKPEQGLGDPVGLINPYAKYVNPISAIPYWFAQSVIEGYNDAGVKGALFAGGNQVTQNAAFPALVGAWKGMRSGFASGRKISRQKKINNEHNGVRSNDHQTQPSPIQTPSNVEYSDYLADSYANMRKYQLLLNDRNRIPYKFTREAKDLNTAHKIRDNSQFWRGSFSSDVFVPKNKINGFEFKFLPEQKPEFKSVHRASKSFRNSVGELANPEQYYRVNLNTLLTSESPAFADPELRNIINSQIKFSRHSAKSNAAGVDFIFNPNTIKLGTQFIPGLHRNLTFQLPVAKQLQHAASAEIFWTPYVSAPSHFFRKKISNNVEAQHNFYGEHNEVGKILQAQSNLQSSMPESEYSNMINNMVNYRDNPNDSYSEHIMKQMDLYYGYDADGNKNEDYWAVRDNTLKK